MVGWIVRSPTPCNRCKVAGLRHIAHSDHIDQHADVAVITETNAVTFCQNLGEMLDQVQYRRDSIVIKRDGKAVAALVDAKLFDWSPPRQAPLGHTSPDGSFGLGFDGAERV